MLKEELKKAGIAGDRNVRFVRNVISIAEDLGAKSKHKVVNAVKRKPK